MKFNLKAQLSEVINFQISASHVFCIVVKITNERECTV